MRSDCLSYVPVSQWTMEEEGAKWIEIELIDAISAQKAISSGRND